ncbi:hypothetical protein BASA83_002140 [Batrachochytrium salamandrivorans]|nr:hypothetical protein BASA83_002140 [Batrachochytrium salamandrivorans]
MQTVSLVNKSITSLQHLVLTADALNGRNCDSTSSLNLHCNEIRILDRTILRLLTALTTLDLSSNMVESMAAIDSLPQLIDLNLANNLIVHVQGISGLRHLQRLNLSFNRIADLSGFVDGHGGSASLSFLDLRANAIADLGQMNYLSGCMKLTNLRLAGWPKTSRENPVCSTVQYQRSTIFRIIPQLCALDGRDSHENEVSDRINSLEIRGFQEYEHPVSLQPTYSQVALSSQRVEAKDRHKTADNEPLSSLLERMSKVESQLFSAKPTSTQPIREPSIPSAHPSTDLKPDRITEISERLNSFEDHLSKLELARSPEKQPEHPTLMSSETHPPTASTKEQTSTENERRLGSIEKQLSKLLTLIPLKSSVGAHVLHRDTINTSSEKQSHTTHFDHGDCFIEPPTQDFKKDSKNTTLVWIEDQPCDLPLNSGELHTATHPNVRIRSSNSMMSKPTVQHQKVTQLNNMSKAHILKTGNKVLDISSSVNSKLIATLEQEEKRLRNNELQYAERIRSLTEELRLEREISKHVGPLTEQLKAMRTHVEKQSESHTKQDNELKQVQLRLEKQFLELQIVQKRLVESEAKLAQKTSDIVDTGRIQQSYQAELDLLSEELEASQKRAHDAEIKIVALQNHLQENETDRHKVVSKLIKDREQYKIKIAENKTEIDISQKTIDKLEKELRHAHDTLAVHVSDNQKHLETLNSKYQSQLESTLSQTSSQLTKKHQTEINAIQSTLQQTRQAYHDLEHEFRISIKGEHGRYSELQKLHSLAIERIEQHERSAEAVTKNEEKLATMIKDLSNVIREQKSKIINLSKHNQLSIQVYEEQIQSLELKFSKSLKANRDYDTLHQQMVSRDSELSTKQALLEQAISKSKQLEDQIALQMEQHDKHVEGREHSLKSIREECDGLREKTGALDYAVRVKSKMLDDQNETIRTLKQNLENKARDHQSLLANYEKCQEELDELRHLDSGSVEDLRSEIQLLEESVERYRSTAQEYRNDRDLIAKELEDTHKRLHDRNESIKEIEHEVGRVKEQFKLKEDRIRAEKEQEIQKLKSVLDPVDKKLENYERERFAMVDTISRLQHDLQDMTSRCATQENDVKTLFSELETYKRNTCDKITRLKATLNEL